MVAFCAVVFGVLALFAEARLPRAVFLAAGLGLLFGGLWLQPRLWPILFYGLAFVAVPPLSATFAGAAFVWGAYRLGISLLICAPAALVLSAMAAVLGMAALRARAAKQIA